MALRITTWNVNGIRNPFGYQPWRDNRTFQAMFDTLEADIIVLQETKIQRKDLTDDMVLVPGFDCYWSLPRHKKGYSGVVIYTRQSKCAPIRAEEGITGILCLAGTDTSHKDLPPEEQIGGYPDFEQLSESDIDPAELDSEGRCVILEFPAFVLVGTYCPAERDDTRTHWRTAFLKVLDSRLRNLIKLGKQVIWTGDLNISREEIDTAMADEMMRKNSVDHVGWISTPARRLFNQLLDGGKVYGSRDEGRENSVMWDVTRAFHPTRRGMYTCWETKTNARPGNYGARIDYIISSIGMKDWWQESNIQEGLMGSDHCPVYAVLKEYIEHDEQTKHLLDVMNPPDMFVGGVRRIEWSSKNLLPTSGKLIPEFDRRRNIRDMFTRSIAADKSETFPPSRAVSSSFDATSPEHGSNGRISNGQARSPRSKAVREPLTASKSTAQKRAYARTEGGIAAKRARSDQNTSSKGQQSLKGFFSTQSPEKASKVPSTSADDDVELAMSSFKSSVSAQIAEPLTSVTLLDTSSETPSQLTDITPPTYLPEQKERSAEQIVNGLENAKSWNTLFAKPKAPRCEHNEPCKTMLTKKPGINCGRSFWMCQRPLGPSGDKESNSQWRCKTFIWASDWESRISSQRSELDR